MRFLSPALLFLLIAPGCSTRNLSMDSPAARPALINHVVFFQLQSPQDADELIEDCDRLLAVIPGVTSYFCGEHIDTGRDTVNADYDVGLYVGYDALEDYAAYVDHPNHIELVTKWRPRLESLVVRDIHDSTE